MQGSAREDAMPEIRITELEPYDGEGLDHVYTLYAASILRTDRKSVV